MPNQIGNMPSINNSNFAPFAAGVPNLNMLSNLLGGGNINVGPNMNNMNMNNMNNPILNNMMNNLNAISNMTNNMNNMSNMNNMNNMGMNNMNNMGNMGNMGMGNIGNMGNMNMGMNNMNNFNNNNFNSVNNTAEWAATLTKLNEKAKTPTTYVNPLISSKHFANVAKEQFKEGMYILAFRPILICSHSAVYLQSYYVIAVSSMCANYAFPREMAIVEFSLSSPKIAEFHRFIDPGYIPDKYVLWLVWRLLLTLTQFGIRSKFLYESNWNTIQS